MGATEVFGITGSTMPLITFLSKPQILVAPDTAQLHIADLDGLRVCDIAEPANADGLPEGARQYCVQIAKEVDTLEESLEAHRQADSLIADLERVWAYSAGLPLRPLRTYLEVHYALEGWTSNVEEVQNAIRAQKQGITGTVRIVSRHWMHAPHFPLRLALEAVVAFRNAQPVVRSRVELHFSALTSARVDGRLFFFAKALELVRALLPGADVRAKSAGLHPEIQGELVRPFSWLYDMSNHRFDVRHVVRDPQGPDLHPLMTPEELRDFEHDADLVIRGVIAQHLAIELAVARTGPPPAA